MSTRSIIARPWGDGFEGRYCHSDGYPSGVGAALWHGYRDAFHGDLDAMIDKLVEQEKTGWSVICGYDLSLPAGWVDVYNEGNGTPADKYRENLGERFSTLNYERLYAENGPQSYTHRGETHEWMIQCPGDGQEFDTGGTEFAYVLSPRGMFVFKVGDTATGIGFVPWDGPEPDWETLECGEQLERCPHVDDYHEDSAV